MNRANEYFITILLTPKHPASWSTAAEQDQYSQRGPIRKKSKKIRKKLKIALIFFGTLFFNMRQVVQMLALLTGTCVAAPPTNRVCADNADCGDRSWHCGAKGRCEQVRDEEGKDDVWLDQTTYHLVQSWSMIHGRNNVNLNSTLFQPSRGRRSSRRHLGACTRAFFPSS